MYLPAKTFSSHKKFLNVKRPMPCYTIRAECKANKCLERSAGPDYSKIVFKVFLSNSEDRTQDNIVWDNRQAMKMLKLAEYNSETEEP